uniref:Uncharacterized protein n=1 Tax=Strongyloides papillosus TaxID=174720 RepID=A0A0N5C0D2_STREA
MIIILKCDISCKISPVRFKILTFRSLSNNKNEDYDISAFRKPVDYKPGSDLYACKNPYLKLSGSSLDELFGDEWRRPLAKDQGGKMVCF